MKKFIFDIEADGLLDTITKIHCLSYTEITDDDNPTVHTTFDPDTIRDFFNTNHYFIGHDILRYDCEALKKILGIDFKGKTLEDTLALSWYLNFKRPRHGLGVYGDEYGVPKPAIDDWEGLSPEEYGHRCEEDVKINLRLYRELHKKLDRLYYQDPEGKERLIEYLTFKMTCAAKQQELGWNVDSAAATALMEELAKLKSDKREALADAMPLNVVTGEKNKPKVYIKKDGTLSAHGLHWNTFLEEQGLPSNTEGPVSYIIEKLRANPDSSPQVKEWLFYLGWVPTTFDYKRNDDGTERKIPQVRGSNKELCPSVLELVDRDPAIKMLDGYTVLTHRLGIVEKFVRYEKNGKLKASVQGLTNTFRFKHVDPLVNLPGIDKPYGKEIRGLLISPDNHVSCGADMVSLEDTTKRHYMMPHDPDYCEEMNKEGWDSHLDLAKFAKAITEEQIQQGGPEVKTIRKAYKAANYSCVYGVQATTLSRATGLSIMKAQSLIDAYWERNWAVKTIAEGITIRKVGTEQWVQNPISGFWHNLRNKKDIWSTINQSSGVYCFDTWLKHCTKRDLWPIGQFHDEVILSLHYAEERHYEKQLKAAMVDTNAELNLNVTLDIDVQFGQTYADIH